VSTEVKPPVSSYPTEGFLPVHTYPGRASISSPHVSNQEHRAVSSGLRVLTFGVCHHASTNLFVC